MSGLNSKRASKGNKKKRHGLLCLMNYRAFFLPKGLYGAIFQPLAKSIFFQ
jgi:hypothetical protein